MLPAHAAGLWRVFILLGGEPGDPIPSEQPEGSPVPLQAVLGLGAALRHHLQGGVERRVVGLQGFFPARGNVALFFQGNNDDLILSCCLHYCNDKAKDFMPSNKGRTPSQPLCPPLLQPTDSARISLVAPGADPSHILPLSAPRCHLLLLLSPWLCPSCCVFKRPPLGAPFGTPQPMRGPPPTPPEPISWCQQCH